MRAFGSGVFCAITVTRREVAAFKVSWPCCSLPDRAITFHFDKRNGDLVDITPYSIAARVDGSEGVALSQDAQAYAVKRGLLPDWCAHAVRS